MIFNLDNRQGIALKDTNGHALTYQELAARIEEVKQLKLERSVAFILAGNNVETIALFLALLECRVVPFILNAKLDATLLERYIFLYQPRYICRPGNGKMQFREERLITHFLGYEIWEENNVKDYEIHESLSFLLATSGSTGSPKLVRYSYHNLLAGVDNVAQIFQLNSASKGLINLPVYFVQGFVAALAHLWAGGEALLSDLNLISRDYWDLLRNSKCTFITGVPFSWEVMVRLGLLKMTLPDLKILNVGGGSLDTQLFTRLAEWADKTGKKLIITYGATETVSRMMYLPPDLVMKKTGSIGYPVPHGRMELVDESGDSITDVQKIGEMIYSGSNVSLGYAESWKDLAKGDERHGRYATGDIAYFDEDGCYFVIGRKARFTKIFGYRIGLDEVEAILKAKFAIPLACTGDDQCVRVYVECDVDERDIVRFISEKLKLLPAIFKVIRIPSIPRNNAGKILYAELK